MYKKLLIIPLITAALLATSGCALIYKPTGWVLTSLTQDKVLPYVLASGDLRQTACGTGMGLGQLLGSFTYITGRPHKSMVSIGTLTGLCSANKAQRYHLLYVRALNAGKTDRARDYRTMEMRLWRITTLRRYQAYKDTVAAFGEIGNGVCPDLGENDLAQVQYLAGMLTSVQALLADIRSGTSVGVPQSIAANVAQEIQCLDNKEWWGVPQAVRAVVWLSVPGTKPEGVNAWHVLKEAALMGKRQGMPLAAALYVVAAYGTGDLQRQKQGIRWINSIFEHGIGPTNYLVLAEVAFDLALYYSDIIWIKKTGRRTPFQKLGTFPSDQEHHKTPDINFGDIL